MPRRYCPVHIPYLVIVAACPMPPMQDARAQGKHNFEGRFRVHTTDRTSSSSFLKFANLKWNFPDSVGILNCIIADLIKRQARVWCTDSVDRTVHWAQWTCLKIIKRCMHVCNRAAPHCRCEIVSQWNYSSLESFQWLSCAQHCCVGAALQIRCRSLSYLTAFIL